MNDLPISYSTIHLSYSVTYPAPSSNHHNVLQDHRPHYRYGQPPPPPSLSNNQPGANSGIGLETVKALASSTTYSYQILLCSRSLEKGEAALKDASSAASSQSTISLLQLDVTDEASITAAAKKVETDYGRLDVLINNAGFIDRSPKVVERYRKTFETNVFGTLAVTEAFAPLLRKSANARLIYVSSSLGSLTYRTRKYRDRPAVANAYLTSKTAMNMLSCCAVAEYGAWCKVWAFDPGLVATGLSGEPAEKMRERGAGEASVSGESLKAIVEGGRDGEVGEFVWKDGVHPW